MATTGAVRRGAWRLRLHTGILLTSRREQRSGLGHDKFSTQCQRPEPGRDQDGNGPVSGRPRIARPRELPLAELDFCVRDARANLLLEVLRLGDFVGTATSLHRFIDWNFVWPDPVISELHAVALTDGIVARLRAAL